ncbi:MAG: hypothetical protein QN167_06740 [Armatimonadota bacterium]|nr:hypothetical protein [Armatimonadota bacterium]MDR7488503.1 hypothetical protein [Armatimonadota bacterium]MDR7573806.1 hypothetical protein [Armatimonadota bacterium]
MKTPAPVSVKNERLQERRRKNFVGIQIGLVSFLDEGVAPVLDFLQEKARVNALLPSTISWSRGNAGRATDWYPDHGKAEPDDLIGGAMFRIDPRYYHATSIKEFAAPDPLYQGVDFLELIQDEAKERGIGIYPYYCETSRIEPRSLNVPGWVHLLEVDAQGRRTGRPCVNNPDYLAWWRAVLENHFRNYDLDGFCWGVERKGPLFLLMDGAAATCFCQHCRSRARDLGVDVEAARRGYLALEEYFHRARAGQVHDGYFVEFVRVLFRHPAILAYEQFWHESHKGLAKEVYGTIKWLKPTASVGMHIWQYVNTFNPFLRAQWDLSEFRQFADWVKPVLYHVAAGPRFAEIVRGYSRSWLGDFAPGEALPWLYRILQLNEAPFDQLPHTPFSTEYVFRETVRTLRAVGPGVQVYPGIGVGVQGIGELRITPADVTGAVRAAYEAGADGIVLCRNYSEAMLDTLAAVGAALRELGITDTIPEGIARTVPEAVRPEREMPSGVQW